MNPQIRAIMIALADDGQCAVRAKEYQARWLAAAGLDRGKRRSTCSLTGGTMPRLRSASCRRCDLGSLTAI